MRFQVILNRDGGTLRTLDLDRFAARTRATLEGAGHEVAIAVVPGDEIGQALDEAAAGECDVVMVGGGDGTVSGAAGRLNGSKKTLAVLPAGTMNLFARSLGIPLDLDAAVAAVAGGRTRKVDLASADGRIFVHQFSVGLQTKLIRLREKRAFNSRLGKMRASALAGAEAFLRPPRMRAALTMDGAETTVKTAFIGVTNNLLGDLPYAEKPDGGLLGVYVTQAAGRRDLARLALQMVLGRWRDSEQIDIHGAKEVTLRLLSRHERFGCSIDGELCELGRETTLRIHPGALNALVPAG